MERAVREKEFDDERGRCCIAEEVVVIEPLIPTF